MNKTGKIALISAVVLVLVLSVVLVSAKRGGGAPRECRDGIDNDGDGLVDWPADPGCRKRSDRTEQNCGNGVVDGTEVCDGSNLNGETCSSQGFDDGTLACASSCQAFDTSGCFDNPTQVCGNNIREGTEVCDGTDLDGESCSSQGHDGGSLSCTGACDGFVTSGCWDNSCSDTDGFTIYTQGTVSGDFEGSPYSFTDSCITAEVVREWYCSGSQAFNFDQNCSGNFTSSCSMGACV